MSNAISVENLSKSYTLLHEDRARYSTFREAVPAMLRNLGRAAVGQRRHNTTQEEFWALRDVNFEVKEGDKIGIVGRNGAGKSTLLKLLSRITEPTLGTIKIRGRLASLLEVGTGFNPELTGRENIFLNGAILGMSRHEIARRFDEIVAFAEVEKFLDTPVKRYSSGMYMRLAFGVAAHLEPEVLVVDEVLAVGDAQFQKKCLGKMGELSSSGRTILFVTHNMDAMITLCNRGIVLNQGELIFDGDAMSARSQYLSLSENMQFSIGNHGGRGGSGGVSIRSVDVIQDGDAPMIDASITSGDRLRMRISCHVDHQYASRDDLQVAIGIDSVDGQRVFTYISAWDGISIAIVNGEILVECAVETVPFIAGRYLISATVLFQGETLDSVQHCASFWVVPKPRGVHIDRSSGWGVVDVPCVIRNI